MTESTPLEPFGARLRRAMDERGPLCVGIDPHAALLADWGLSDDIAGLERFTRTVVEALADRVAVLKPQSAFFERFGSRGIAVLEQAVADSRAAGALVLMDAKRGDIGSTMAAYAATYLDPASPLFSDAVTVSPYLGYGSLRPALDLARESGTGVFVLALTSNPEGAEVQHAVRADGASVAATMLEHVKAENADAAPMGSYGAVVGATLGDTLGAAGVDLAINGPLLAPGIGAQGATPADLPRVFGAAVRDVVPNVSRGVLRHGPDVTALRASAARFAGEVRDAVDTAASR
ncbi:orotidine 5'-phosphate decarboxylase [Streptomyces netropsis]|uniref:Orotidine 5'-phosphate decarboxylase n=2 Tax=Streptomyces syringium TaxID=76729 RepID=A0ABS4XZE1_9ACTN|nr:orotidine-5'-phosphate decarboxylase [Streptomyces syringium]MBP2401886.1 orotidine-5'-phosphate decarboxylase [Streptomyces syringium]SPE48375.1 orotidine 5'-phosphate decarboxylase [Streptomyces netropsis]